MKLGFSHGLHCIGCCWALMVLAFVGGTMNLVWMCVATALMALEKLARPAAEHLRVGIGVVLIAAGGFAAAGAI